MAVELAAPGQSGDWCSTTSGVSVAAAGRSARLQSDAALPRGCMLVLSVANASPDNAHLQEAAAAERRKTREAIRRCLDRGVQAGELRPDVDAEGLSTLVEALLVGMSIQARDGVPGASLQAAVAGVLRLWDANSGSGAS